MSEPHGRPAEGLTVETNTVPAAGEAGHIGFLACKALKRAKFVPAAFDNLAAGWEDAVRFGPSKGVNCWTGNALNRPSVPGRR